MLPTYLVLIVVSIDFLSFAIYEYLGKNANVFDVFL